MWTLIPPQRGDFNVPTPIDAGGKLIVATENNGARLYEFETGGRIRTSPTAAYGDLSPDSSTPVLLGGRLFGSCNTLCCLDVAAKLNVLWTGEDDVFSSYASLIACAGPGVGDHEPWRIAAGECVGGAVRNRIAPASLSEGERGAFAPVLVGSQIYIRDMEKIECVDSSTAREACGLGLPLPRRCVG